MDKQAFYEKAQKYQLPKAIKTALAVFDANGYQAYVVGGAVRDILRGVEPHDFDIAAQSTPDKTKHLFSFCPTYDTGIKHGTVTVNLDGELLEITTFRTDGEYVDSRHPESVEFTSSIREDLARRDFTVNAMALDLHSRLCDPFDGIGDLSAGIIRAVGEPTKRFNEDALRIMRAFRFSAVLSFVIEENTLRAASACACGLDKIARERIGEEWKKLLLADAPSKTLLIMESAGILDRIFPNAEIPKTALEIVDALEPIYTLRLAALFAHRSASELSDCFGRICLTASELSQIRDILTAYADISTLSSENLRSFCYKHQDNAVYAAEIAERFGVAATELPAQIKLVFADPLMIRSRKELAINGNDILSHFSLDPRSVGALTNRLILEVVEGRVKNDKESLLAALSEMI